jgi:transcriptional regulator with XRE-family HTH domain
MSKLFNMRRTGAWTKVAQTFSGEIGREVMLARANLGLSRRSAARLAGVSASTLKRVEDGDPALAIDTITRVAWALGLKLWAKAFPVRTPSLRDTGQLRIADLLRTLANAAYRTIVELGLGNGRSADLVLMGAVEIIHIEIERLLHDFQAQYRAAVIKRDELAAAHQRPVRLVLAVQDTRHNRRVFTEHDALIRSVLPAGSREVLHALRTGDALGRDGLMWVRPR